GGGGETGCVGRGDAEGGVGQPLALPVPLGQRPRFQDDCHIASLIVARKVVSMRASMLSSSRPAWRALSSHCSRSVRNSPCAASDSSASVLVTKVPTPGRAAASPSYSSSRYALSTVFGLIASRPTTSLTVGS